MTDHVDVLIVGAGLSGIGAAWRLQAQHPGRSYVILEGRDSIGGTWDLFRYPGVRSDSDMFTLSYPFRPWQGSKSMADGPSILQYIRDTADEAGITKHIRFGTSVTGASWSSERALWTVKTSKGEYTADFVYACAGYYHYDKGYQPDFAGLDEFAGSFVHPQFWPEDLDHAGKRVVVIGSGATAVTLVPAMAETAEHVTMLQRSPTYITVLPAIDTVAEKLHKRLPAKAAFRLTRMKNIAMTSFFYRLARRQPDRFKRILRDFAVKRLNGDEAYVDAHFTPRYEPWDQRLCVVPDGDLFTAINEKRASVVTDTIDRFVPEGVRLSSGEVLEADIVVSATGITLQPVGGMTLNVDGEEVDPATRVAYRGLMLSGVPNFAFCIGYTNASWTLRSDLCARYVCRLLSYMDRNGYSTATPHPGPSGPLKPLLSLTSGYVQRALDNFPKQGERDPWSVKQNYMYDAIRSPRADLSRDMTFSRRPAKVGASA